MVSAIQNNGQALRRKGIAGRHRGQLDVQNGAQDDRAAALLGGVAEAARRLLVIANLNTAINGALEAIAISASIDRIYILENFTDIETGEVFSNCPYEWTTEEVVRCSDTPGRFPMALSDFGDWLEKWQIGQATQALASDLSAPAQELQAQDEALSLLAVPIFVEAQLWGVVGFDDCTTERAWSEAEIAVLETVAACVGGAIERDRTQKARIAEVEAHNQTLAERDRILEATAAAANVMLVNDDFESAVNEALRIVGEGLSVDRVLLGKHFIETPDEGSYVHFLYEWHAPGTIAQVAHPELSKISSKGIEFAFEILESGKIFGGVIDDLLEPFRGSQVELGVKSTYAIPISVSGRYWGLLSLDDCHRKTYRGEAELGALRTLANCIGSAIERDQIRAQREAAERAAIIERERAARADELEAANKVLSLRDQWLQTTAEAANKLLSTTDVAASVAAALATIGENLACDRLTVLQHVEDINGHPFGAMQGIYEWDAEGIRAQLDDPNLQLISAEGFEAWFDRFFVGEWVGGNVADLPEPARSGQESLGVLSTYAVPIFIDNQLWGAMGMDYCREARQLSAPELAVFKTAASCVGSAIYQAQVRRDKAAQVRAAELAKMNEAIAQTLTTLAASPELDQFLGTILAEMSRQLSAAKVHLFLYDAPTHTLTQRVAVQDGQVYLGPGPNDPEVFNHPVPADITSGWSHIINGGKPITYDETQPIDEEVWWPETIAWHKAQGHKAITCIPLKAGDVPIGYIGFCFCDRTFLSDEQLEFMQALANQAIVAIQLTRLGEEAKQAAILQEKERAAQERVVQLSRSNQALKRSLDSLAQQPELEAFLQGVVNEAAAQTGAATGHLFIFDADRDLCRLHVSTDNNGDWRSVPDMSLWFQPIPMNEVPLFWEKISERKAFVLEDMQSDLKPGPHIWEPSIDWHLRRGHTSAICAPLALGERVLGFLGLAFIGETNITQEDVELAQALTNQATLAVQVTRLAEEAKQAAILQTQEKAARERAAELAKSNEAIGHTLTALTETPELDAFLSQNLTKMAEYVDACKANLFLYDEATHTLSQYITVQDTQVYQGYAPTDPKLFQHPIPADISDAWEVVARSEKPFVLDANHPEAAQSYWPGTVEWHEAQGHLSSACACMKVGNKAIGFIGFAFRSVAVLSDEQLEFIQALTNQATLSIHLTRLAEQAKSSALTEERNRLAREIHDTLAQAFTGISLQLEAGKSLFKIDATETYYHINRAGEIARKGLAEARRSVRGLRSQALATDTLPEALRATLSEMTRDSSTQATLQLRGAPYALPEDIQTNLLRIGQEATTNALRHAEASNLTLTLTYEPDQVHLQIADDGKGSKVTSLDQVEGFGLLGMRERTHRFSGEFRFTSAPGKGTTIDIAIPTHL